MVKEKFSDKALPLLQCQCEVFIIRYLLYWLMQIVENYRSYLLPWRGFEENVKTFL